MAQHTLRVGFERREFRVTARGDKSLKSVARSIAKRLGCSRVTLFANARALDESLTVGAVVASGVGRVEAVPCDDAPAVAQLKCPARLAVRARMCSSRLQELWMF